MSLPSIRPTTAPEGFSDKVYRPASRDGFMGAGPALVPRPASARPAFRPPSATRRVLPAFFFAESAQTERSDRYPTPMSYQVVDEDGSCRTTGRDHTEGTAANIAHTEQQELRHMEGDFRRFRSVDFQVPSMAPELVNRGAGVVPVDTVAKWMDASKPRTRLDAYPMLVLLREILRQLLKSDFDASEALVAQLRARLKELEELMVSDRKAHEARMAELTARHDGLLTEAADLEGQITTLRDETAEMKAHLSVQLSQVKEKLREVERESRSLQKQIDKTTEKLAELAERLANALRHAYEPAALALALHTMLENGSFVAVLKQLSYEERMNLFHSLLKTCSKDEKNQALEIVMDEIQTGDLQLDVLHDCLNGPQRAEILQLLLAEVEHDPGKIYEQLGLDVLQPTSVGFVQEVIVKGCSKTVLLDALGLTPADIAKSMLEEIGIPAFLHRLDISRDGLADALGLEEPAEPAEPPPKPETAEAETQTDPEPEPEPEPEPPPAPKKKRTRSKVLNFFGKVPLKGGPSPMAFNPLRKTISTLYESKIQADEIDDREGHIRSPFPEFIQEYFINHYGLKSLADKQLGKLVTGVRKYSKEGKFFDLRIKVFGVLSGILEPDAYSTVTVNFVLDVMRMLFVSNMIDESLNHPECAVSYDQAELALSCICELFEQQVPEGLLDTLKGIGEEVDVGEEEPIVEIEIDPFLDTVMRAWIDTQQEGSRHLNETFHKYDEDGDGMLSLKEFTDIVREVEKIQKRFPRPLKEIRKMYLEAIEESAAGDDAITQVAFLSVAKHYHLGVPFVDPSRRAMMAEDKDFQDRMKSSRSLSRSLSQQGEQ